MAHFRGTVQGNRGEVSSLGTKDSGLVVTANGWNIGVKVELTHVDGKDKVIVRETGGSNGYSEALVFEKEVEA